MTITRKACIMNNVRRGFPNDKYTGQEVLMENEAMTNDQFNSYLENLAKLIEAKATTPQEAAQLVRESKAK